MTNILKSQNIYKLIVLIFLIVAIVKINSQLITLNTYNAEIDNLNEKIATLKSQDSETNISSNNQKQETENIARKDLKMYYPNETPYKGY